jgi:hypothetical protein
MQSRKPNPSPARSFFRPGRLLLALLLLLAVLAAGHAVLWRVMSGRLEDGWRIWSESRRAQVWQILHATPVPGGWPWAATLTLSDFRMAGGRGMLPGGLEWQAESLVLRVALPRLSTLLVEPEGRQRLRLGTTELPFAADRLSASLPLAADVTPGSAHLQAERLRLGPAAGGVEIATASADIASRSTAIAAEPALTLSATLEGITLPAGAPLGRQMQEARLDAALTGPVPPPGAPRNRATQWRDGGGTLELRALSLRWGEVAGSAAATLALDEALQPMGAGTLRIANATRALEGLVAAGVVPSGSAGLVRSLLPMLSRPDPEGGPPQLELPVTLEGRTLSTSRLPLLRLPPLDW